MNLSALLNLPGVGLIPEFVYAIFLWALNMVDAYVFDLAWLNEEAFG